MAEWDSDEVEYSMFFQMMFDSLVLIILYICDISLKNADP